MSVPDSILAEILPDLEGRIASFSIEQRLPGMSVGLVVDQELAWSCHLGAADLESRRRADDGTLYRIASITKTFTAAAIVQLAQEGRLRLDDPLAAHLPEACRITNPFGSIDQVTIRRVLLHMSGLQCEGPVRDPRQWTLLPADEVRASLDEVAVVIEPGTAYKYSNIGYHLLGEVIERVSGKSYGDHLRGAILGPLAMDDTTLNPTGVLAGRRAVGYDPQAFDDEVRQARQFEAGTTIAAGGLWSTVADLARWIALQFRTDPARACGGDQILAGPSLDAMHRALILGDDGWSHARGLGWSIRRIGTVSWVGHGGFLDGFNSVIRFSSADKIGAIVLLNGSGPRSADDLAIDLLEVAHPVVCNAAKRTGSGWVGSATPAAWRPLLGRYAASAHANGFRIEARQGRLLFVHEDGDADVVLTPTTDPLVFIGNSGALAGETIRFLQGPDGQIDGLSMYGYPARRVSPAEVEDKP